MGGKLRPGKCVVGGVVETEVRDFYDKLVRRGIFRTRSQAIGFALKIYADRTKEELGW
jgi:Arc/MetJ-type ribon-helix-helix transcriptional regulator